MPASSSTIKKFHPLFVENTNLLIFCSSLFVKIQEREEVGEIDELITQFKQLLKISSKYLKSKKDASIESLTKIIESRIFDLESQKISSYETDIDSDKDKYVVDCLKSCKYNKNVRFMERKTVYYYNEDMPVHKSDKKNAYLSISMTQDNVIHIINDIFHIILTSDDHEVEKTLVLDHLRQSFYLDDITFKEIAHFHFTGKYALHDLNLKFETENSECLTAVETFSKPKTEDRCKLKYINLFKVLIAYDHINVSEVSKKSNYISKLYQLIQEKFSLFKPINIFEELPQLSYDCILMHISSSVSNYLLNLYANYLGISQFLRFLVLLDYIIEKPGLNVDNFIIIYVILSEILKLFKDKYFNYTEREYSYFARIMKSLCNDVKHYLRNMFQYISNNDIVPLKILHHICCLIDQFNVFTSFNLSSPECLKKAVEHSIRNYYQFILNNTRDEKDPNIGDPIGKNPSIIIKMKRRKEDNPKAKQLIKIYKQIVGRIENLQNFESFFEHLGISVYEQSCSIYFYQYFVHVKRFMMTDAAREPTVDVLRLGLLISKINMVYIPKLIDVEEISVDFLFSPFYDKWLAEQESILNNWITNLCSIENWEPLDIDGSQIWSRSCIDFYNEYSKFLLFANVIGSIFSGGASIDHKSFKVLKSGLTIYIESIYSQFIEEFPNYLQTKLHDLYMKEILGKNRHSQRQTRTYRLSKHKLRNSKNLHTCMDKIKDRFNLHPSMCIKINNILQIKILTHKLIRKYSSDSDDYENTFQLIDEVTNAIIKMVIYAMNVYIRNKIQLIYKSTKKGLDSYVFSTITSLLEYINNQIATLKTYLNPGIYKAFLHKLWNEIKKDMKESLRCESSRNFCINAIQCTVIKDLFENIKYIIYQNEMSYCYLKETFKDIFALSQSLPTISTYYHEVEDDTIIGMS